MPVPVVSAHSWCFAMSLPLVCCLNICPVLDCSLAHFVYLALIIRGIFEVMCSH